MTETTDILYNVPLLNFLNAYPEPAFILCTSSAPRLSLEFIYGNPALHTLVFGHDDSGVLDSDSFFSAVASNDDIAWLSNPTYPQTLATAASELHYINLRPAWLPRDHTPLDLELTPTPIDLPVTIPGVGSSSKSYVFTATPRKVALDLLRSDSRPKNNKRRDSGPPANDLSPFIMIYNDAYARMISIKHPSNFGKPGAAAWGELWEMLTP
ncbi:hypothetical protein FRC07_002032, partial [Ceratobasidium sp. 392]